MSESIPLRDYLDAQLGGLQDQVDRRFLAAERAVEKADQTINHRLEGMNQFRAQLAEERAGMITRDRQEAVDSAIRDRLGKLEAEQLAGAELATQFRQAQDDIDRLKNTSAGRGAVDAYRRWLVGLSIAFCGAFGLILVNLFLNLLRVVQK